MIRNLILAVLAVTASAMLPTSGLSQTGGTNLRWQFPVGRKLEIEVTQRTKNGLDVPGSESATAVSTTNYMTWEVESVDESSGVATIKSQIDRMTMDMNSPQGKLEIDTDSDKELEGMAKVVGEKLVAIVGKTFGQTMDASGEVLSVDFPKDFSQAVMGKGGMEKLIKNTLPKFPSDPVAVGQTWNQETIAPMPGGFGEMQLESNYTYKGRETVEGRELEVINIDRTVAFKAMENSPAAIEITEQSTVGKMYFDAANGHATSLNVKQSMTMDIGLGGQTISQTIENTTEGKFRLAK